MTDSQDEFPTFSNPLIRELLSDTEPFADNKLEISEAAVELSGEYLRLFALEAYRRASELAEKDGSPMIEVDHLKRITPGLLLDFR